MYLSRTTSELNLQRVRSPVSRFSSWSFDANGLSLLVTMFCKASLFTVALALLASASPVVKEGGIRIDLPKRSSLTRADGVFDHDKAIIASHRTIK